MLDSIFVPFSICEPFLVHAPSPFTPIPSSYSSHVFPSIMDCYFCLDNGSDNENKLHLLNIIFQMIL